MSADVRVLFLRGINVGGRNVLPMADLRDLLAGLGLGGVKTHIQSGNVVFRDLDGVPDLAVRIGDAIAERFRFRPMLMLVGAAGLARVLAENPFATEGVADGAKVHIGFLAQPATDADLSGLQQSAAADERFHITAQAFYLHAPSGIGRSKLAAGAEKLLGVGMTMRNQRVATAVSALAELCREEQEC